MSTIEEQVAAQADELIESHPEWPLTRIANTLARHVMTYPPGIEMGYGVIRELRTRANQCDDNPFRTPSRVLAPGWRPKAW